MSITQLLHYLPENTIPHLKKWFGAHQIHIKITKGRDSKLGDYKRLSKNNHQITINSTLQPELFFFVLTHELAHLIVVDQYGRKAAPHGAEWKSTYREMLLESLSVYSEELRPIIINFAKSPKANFMADHGIVRYFRGDNETESEIFIEKLSQGDEFIYRKHQYVIEQKLKKNYLCTHLGNGKKYVFKPVTIVEKVK